MIAVIVATGRNPAFEGLQETVPVPLLPIGERPFIQHIVEYLANQGVRRFEFVLSHLPEKIEATLGDGARWGCAFRYHLAPAEDEALRMAQSIARGLADTILLGTAEYLPGLRTAEIEPTRLIYRDGRWTGWGVFSPSDILLPDFEHLKRMECSYYLSVETGAEFLRSQQQLLNQSFQGLMIYGRQVDPGVWISRNVALHPTAKITPPVYIGENSRIGRGAQIGPFAVIGPNCIVSDHAIVVNSLVASGTFVGEGLELDSVIVDRNRLLNVRLQTSILTSEAFLLSGLTEHTRARGLSRFGSALIAFLFLVFLWPLLLVTLLIVLLTRRGSILPFAAIQIPTDNDPANWRSGTMQHLHVHGSRGKLADFFYRFLPGLLSVLRGDLFLVGVQPRTREQILALSPDWRSLYLGTKAGLITEAAVMFGPDATEDEIYTAEAFYSATESLGHDCRLVGLWFLRLITGPDRSGVDLAEDSDR